MLSIKWKETREEAYKRLQIKRQRLLVVGKIRLIEPFIFWSVGGSTKLELWQQKYREQNDFISIISAFNEGAAAIEYELLNQILKIHLSSATYLIQTESTKLRNSAKQEKNRFYNQICRKLDLTRKASYMAKLNQGTQPNKERQQSLHWDL